MHCSCSTIESERVELACTDYSKSKIGVRAWSKGQCHVQPVIHGCTCSINEIQARLTVHIDVTQRANRACVDVNSKACELIYVSSCELA